MTTSKISVGCLWASRFKLNALERSLGYHELNSHIALVREPPIEATKRIEAISPELESLGLHCGMTVAHARALVPGIVVKSRSLPSESAGLDALRDLVFSCSPVVEVGRGAEQGLFWFDLSGLELLHPDLAQLKSKIESSARRLGFEATLGISQSRLWSRLAARIAYLGKHSGIIDNRQGEELILGLELSVLGLTPKLEATFQRLGLRRISDLLKIPKADLSERLSKAEMLLVEKSLGASDVLKSEREEERFVETLYLDEPVWDLRILMHYMTELMERLSERLTLRGAYSAAHRLELDYDGKGAYQSVIELSVPSRDVRLWRELTLLRLESERPEAPIQSVVWECIPASRTKEQLDLFEKPRTIHEGLELLVTKLERTCAADGVGRIQGGDSYLQDSGMQVPISAKLKVSARYKPVWISGLPRVLRRLRPPEPVEVDWHNGKLSFVKGRDFCGRVRSISGPFRQCGEWWRDDVEIRAEPLSEVQREKGFYWDLYDLELNDGYCLRLLHRIRGNRCFVIGFYD